MKLNFYGFKNEIIFDDNNSAIVIIEDTKLFSKYVYQLFNDQFQDDIAFSDDNFDLLSTTKDILCIMDLFNFDFNDKKVLNTVYKQLESNINFDIELNYHIQQTILEINNKLNDHILEYDIPLIYNNEISISNYLKIINLRITIEDQCDFYGKIESILQVVSELSLFKAITFINVLSLFTTDEINSIITYSYNKKLPILFIENYFDQSKYKKCPIKKYLIDSEFDEIML